MIVTIAVLVLGNNAEIPLSIHSSQSVIVWSGVQDAMIQWWYGHNAVGFFLTAGFLGIMYYFVPKRAGGRSIRTGCRSSLLGADLPLHLGRSAPPALHRVAGLGADARHDLLGHAGMPSWGGMINGLMTLSGAWDKLRTDPVLRMLVVSVAFYGMSTFEGPLMSVKAVNALSHYTDWTIGHVHSGALWLGRLRVLRRAVLPDPVAVQPQGPVFAQAGRLALLARRSASSSTSRRCGWRASCRA